MLADLRFGWRALRRARLYTVTAVLTLALGIALTTAAFSLVDGVLIKPLPYADAGRLVFLGQADAQGRGTGVSYPNFLDWQRQDSAGAFSGIAYARGRGTTLARPEGPAQVLVAFVSPEFFPVVAPRLLLGRLFTAGEAQAGAHLAVLSYGVWRDEFQADPHVVGSTVSTGDGVFTVTGVLAREVAFPEWAGVFLPVESIAASEQVLGARDFLADSRTVARLKPGMTLARGRAELVAIARRLAAAYPAEDGKWPSVIATPLPQYLRGNAPSNLIFLAAAMALVLVIVWVNLTNLALVRATGRIRELAIRTSLGASRRRIVRQLVTEQAMLAAAGAALGAFAATWVLGLIRGFASGAPGSDTVSIDGRALGFAALTGAVSALVVVALPALRAGRGNLTEPLKEGGGGSGTGARQQRIRGVLVAGEIALALMLVIAAGLLVRSFWVLSNVPPGFDTHGLVAVDFSPPGRGYADPAHAGAYYARVLAAARTVPGVERVALTNHMPLNGAALPTTVVIPGRTADPGHDPTVLFRTISPEYASTLKIPVRHGRDFVAADLTGGSAVLVNESFAKAFWPGEDPVGRTVLLHKSAQGFADYGQPLTGLVAGVVGDVHHFGVASPPVPEIYLPYLRNPWGHMVLVARARTDPRALIPGLRRAILGVDPATVLTSGTFGGFAVIDEVRDGGLAGQRFNMLLLGGFALSALLLSAVGVYGLMAYSVSQRSREMGIRLALGARRRDVLRLVLGGGGRLVLAGLVAGLAGALAATRLASSLLFGVSATDPMTFAVMTLVLAAVALLACYLPARRASRVDPVTALRSE